MIFKYKDLQISKEVELDIDKIRAHQECIIRNINLQSNSTLYYNETIDPSLIELEPENIPEERLLLGEISANNFYFDEDRNRYLGLSVDIINFYLDGTNRKKMYLYNIPEISSSAVPARQYEEKVITGIEWYATSAVNDGQSIFEIRDNDTGNSLYTVSNNSGTDLQSDFINTLDVLISADTNISGYVLNNGLDTPVLKVYLRKTYYPV